MKQLHTIQIAILKKLLFSKDLRYLEVKPDSDMDNNQFDFHLDTLIKGNYIFKEDKFYNLTNFGKEYANRIDENNDSVKPQAKIGVMIGAIREKQEREYLIFTRLKHPFYGCQGFLTGKINYGEKVIETAIREFKEETNLEGTPILIGIKHFRVFDDETKELLEDKFMYFYKISNPTGDLIGNNEGKFEWVQESELKEYITKPYDDFDTFMQDIYQINNFKNKLFFNEIDAYSKKF